MGIGRIQGHQNHITWIVHGRDAHKRDNFVVGELPVVLPGVGLFRRAGLSADAEARDLGVFRRTFGDDGFDQLAHGGGGFLGDDLPHHRSAIAFQNIALFIQHLGNYMRLQQIAAVDDGRHRRDHLNGRGLDGLAEGGGDQVAGAVGVVV